MGTFKRNRYDHAGPAWTGAILSDDSDALALTDDRGECTLVLADRESITELRDLLSNILESPEAYRSDDPEDYFAHVEVAS